MPPIQTPERRALGLEILSLHASGYTYKQIGAMHHMTEHAAKGLARSVELQQPRQLDVIHLGSPLELTGDFVIVGDVHIPATDWAFASLVGRVADKTGVRRLIIGGDFFNMDAWSRYPAITNQPTWREERDAARVLIYDWLEVFEEIYTIHGNHDRRLAKFAMGEFDESDVWGMVATSRKLHHSNRGYCTIRSGGQMWRVTHPRNYSRNKLVTADALAQKHQQHIVSFHEHHLGKGMDRFGRYIVVNGGCLVDPCKLAYVEMEDNNMPAMCRGFVMLRDGVAEVFGEYPFTDWSAIFN